MGFATKDYYNDKVEANMGDILEVDLQGEQLGIHYNFFLIYFLLKRRLFDGHLWIFNSFLFLKF